MTSKLFIVLALAGILNAQDIVMVRHKPAPASGISFIGQCNGTTSCTPPSHAIGDLFLVAVGRDASTAAPTLASGWTSVTAPSINGTSTADSVMLVACKVATTTSETVTGFTNGANLVAHVYRGAAAGSTATCASDILGTPGNFTSTVNTTTTTVTYNSITNRDSLSWDVGFAYAPAATAGLGSAPTGMTARSLAGSTKAAGNDTNAAVSSFTTGNVTVTTAGRVITSTFEIKADEGFTVVQDIVTTCGTATTCAISSLAVAAHNTLIYQVMFANGDEQFVSCDKGGTIVPVPGTQGFNGLNSAPMAYVLDASAATATITCTYLHSQNTWIRFLELAHAAGYTPAFDAANSSEFASGVTPTPPTLTLTGTKPFVLQTCAPATSCTAPPSPYDTHFKTDTDSDGSSYVNPAADGVGQAWPLGSNGVTRTSTLALSNGPSACVNQAIVTFEGTNNTAATVANLRTTTTGFLGGVWEVQGTAMKYQNAATKPLTNASGRLCDGSSVASGAGASGIEYVTSAGANSYVQYLIGESVSVNVSAGVWFMEDEPNNNADTPVDIFSIGGLANGDFSTAQLLSNGGTTKCLHIESVNGQDTGCVNISQSTWYWLSLQYNKSGNAILDVYNSAGSLVGTSTKAMAGTTNSMKVVIGQLSATVPTTGFHFDFDSLKLCQAGGSCLP